MSKSIEIKVTHAKTVLQRMKGLLGKKEPHGILINTRFGIHTFGLKFPIDVLVVDEDGKVVKLKRNLKPMSVFFWSPAYDHVIELPHGTISRYEIEEGSVIDLTEED